MKYGPDFSSRLVFFYGARNDYALHDLTGDGLETVGVSDSLKDQDPTD